MTGDLNRLYSQADSELAQNILPFWMTRMVDKRNGGFYGRISGDGITDTEAGKGAILNARILWTFSESYKLLKDPAYAKMARYASVYIHAHFFDPEFGGTYWNISAEGKPLDTKKQIYSQAFFLYALSAYYGATGDQESLDKAIGLYNLIEEKSFDGDKNGYLEAYSREWSLLDDFRLSAKDDNEIKTTNTHLHILEGYTHLYKVWKDKTLAASLDNLVRIFLDKMIHPGNHHLNLFFDEEWNCRSRLISYGHDIEASWLLYEAAQVLENEQLLQRVRTACLSVVKAAGEGLQEDGSLIYESDDATGHSDHERHWWPQAEAVVGYLNAFQLTKNKTYFEQALHSWDYIRENLVDPVNGEWYWSILPDGKVNYAGDKAGFWKCPYHNARACMEIMTRCRKILNG